MGGLCFLMVVDVLHAAERMATGDCDSVQPGIRLAAFITLSRTNTPNEETLMGNLNREHQEYRRNILGSFGIPTISLGFLICGPYESPFYPRGSRPCTAACPHWASGLDNLALLGEGLHQALYSNPRQTYGPVCRWRKEEGVPTGRPQHLRWIQDLLVRPHT